MIKDINELLENLKSGKSQRTKISLDKLNSLLETRFKVGEHDYSIATIAKRSKQTGGVGEVSIRNKTGIHFRVLINAWANKSNTVIKKNSTSYVKNNILPTDMELLNRIHDPALRAVIGHIFAEKSKLKVENRILKSNMELIVDMRPHQYTQPEEVQDKIEIFTSLKGVLVCSEIDALKDAINEKNITNRGWTITRLGAVKDEHDHSLFKPGFITAIQKVLSII